MWSWAKNLMHFINLLLTPPVRLCFRFVVQIQELPAFDKIYDEPPFNYTCTFVRFLVELLAITAIEIFTKLFMPERFPIIYCVGMVFHSGLKFQESVLFRKFLYSVCYYKINFFVDEKQKKNYYKTYRVFNQIETISNKIISAVFLCLKFITHLRENFRIILYNKIKRQLFLKYFNFL